MTEVKDVYSRITNKIVADLERGVRPWHKPWSAGNTEGRIVRPLRHSGVPYQGINVLMLWVAACAKGYSSPMWLTFKQALELGGHVRKGETGELVVYAGSTTREETADSGETTERQIRFLKGYTVFNVEQCEGLPAHYHAKPEAPTLTTMERHQAAEQFIAATRATIRHGGSRAYYAIEPDYVQLPPFETFESPEAYYATGIHELGHWTRHPSRLDRDFGRKRWGDEGYAMEELVAELSAAFLCADLGITPDIREDHAAYLASWLKVLKDDNRAIFSASAFAQRAADYLHGLQPRADNQPASEPETHDQAAA
jgi:antirestriction protein ArdC